MNSPYSRMCNQLENFVDIESEVSDTYLFNRPLEERNGSVDLSPELIKLNVTNPNHSLAVNSPINNSKSNSCDNSTPSTMAPISTTESRSLWLGNIDPTVTEAEVRSVFELYGLVENVRLLPAKECAFVNYYEVESAINARNSMQGKALGNMILRIGFGKISDHPLHTRESFTQLNPQSSQIGNGSNQGQPRSVWIGNLGPEITADMLMFHFNAYGPIESCRILESKNCAFINYYNSEAAALAKVKMNGTLIGNSIIKTGNAKDNASTSNQSSINGNEPISILSQMKSQISKPQPVTFATITANLSDSQGEDCNEFSGIDGTSLREYRRIIEASPAEIPIVLKQLIELGDLKEISIDSYGNILLQKIIERAQESEQKIILKCLNSKIPEIAMHKNGTWVIQKLITMAADLSVQRGTIKYLKNHITELLEDQFGNYVIQCILGVLDSNDENLKMITEIIIQNARRIATGKFSSRALKSILDASPPSRQKQIAQALAKESVLLSVDPNGAVVIQWILDSELPGKIGLITGQLQGRLAQISLTKQGSVIVARIVGSTDEPNFRDSAILELYELENYVTEYSSSSSSTTTTTTNLFKTSSHLSSMLSEPSACSILLKAYQVSKPAIRLRLAEKLKPFLIKILKEVTKEQDEKIIEGYQEKERDEKIPVHLLKLYQELIAITKN